MTPPGNRYDRLNEVDDDAPLFSDETWIQAPDGSWVRSTDKAARKLKGKTKSKVQPEPEIPPARASKPKAEPDPAPAAEPKRDPAPAAEPKRRFGRRSAAEKQRQAELDREAEREREAQRARRAELERDRQADAERAHLTTLERERQAEREFGRQAELDLERKSELERQAALERARAAELEREIELERARVARLEEEVERERQRQADLEYERERERQRQADLEFERERQRQADLEYELERERLGRDHVDSRYSGDLKSSTGTFSRWPDEEAVYPEPQRWPDIGNDYREPDPQYPEPSRWPAADSWSDSTPEPAPRAEPKPKRKAEPKRRKAAHGPRDTGQRVATVATAVAMIALAVVVGAGIRWLGPDPAASQRPFTSAGAPGESLDVRTFTITVQTARAATALQTAGAAQATQGAWVIVRVRLTANQEPTPVGYAAVRDRNGRTYLATDRISQPLIDGSRAFQPGIPIEGEVVFEVPKDALNGLTALFAAHPDRLALDAMAEVALPDLSVAAQQAPATMAPTEVRP